MDNKKYPNLHEFDSIISKVELAIKETYSPDDPFANIATAQDFLPWLNATKENKLMMARKEVEAGARSKDDFEALYNIVRYEDDTPENLAELKPLP